MAPILVTNLTVVKEESIIHKFVKLPKVRLRVAKCRPIFEERFAERTAAEGDTVVELTAILMFEAWSTRRKFKESWIKASLVMFGRFLSSPVVTIRQKQMVADSCTLVFVKFHRITLVVPLTYP